MMSKKVIITGFVCRASECVRERRCVAFPTPEANEQMVVVRCPFLQINMKMVTEKNVVEHSDCKHEFEVIEQTDSAMSGGISFPVKWDMCKKCGASFRYLNVTCGTIPMQISTLSMNEDASTPPLKK